MKIEYIQLFYMLNFNEVYNENLIFVNAVTGPDQHQHLSQV